MHFANKEKVHGKLVRSCSFVLAMIIMCSMLFVGNVVGIEAEAVEFSGCIYFDFKSDKSRSWLTSARLGVRWQDASGNDTIAFPDIYQSGDGQLKDDNTLIYALYIPEGKSCSKVQLLRINPADSSDIWTTSQWFTVPANGNNCLWINGKEQSFGNFIINDGDSGWYTLDVNTSSIKGNQSMTATLDNKDGDSSTGYSYNGNFELYPVDAVFYDYLTDHELVNGWRSNTATNTVSRSYKNRIPYKGFNNYLSEYAVSKSWAYPLYFGNFTSPWRDDDDTHTFVDFHYGTLKDHNMYDSSGNLLNFYGSPSFMRYEDNGISTYTYGSGLANFSIFANDSEALKEKTGTYSGSVQGLVENSLNGTSADIRDRTLKMIGGVDSPYFSGANTYTNTVSTKFPMRVNDTNTVTANDSTSTKYTTYEFNSKGKDDTGNPDIVYFTYDGSGKTNKLVYTQDKSNQILDAYNALGGNEDYPRENAAQNHRGFFPFDHGTNSETIGTDYGFGMRLDIDFNLTKDGNVLGKDESGNLHETDVPMTFDFAGDDDVWVFVDGKLVLDLGGDHGNAEGNINFNIDTQSATVSTGAVTLKDNPGYNTSEFNKVEENAKSFKDIFTADDYNYNADKKEYDVTKNHTLTIFYMERGLVESNLRLSFSISPVGNKLTVDNKIDYSVVTKEGGLQDRVKEYIEGSSSVEKFNFTVSDGTSNDLVYEKSNKFYDYDTTKGAEVDHKQQIKFTNQITDDTDVTVNEKVDSKNNYHYTTTYSVVDNFMKSNNKKSGIDKNYTLYNDTDAASPDSKGEGGSIKFAFDTQSAIETNRYNDFSVSAVNKIQIGQFEITKDVKDSTGTNDLTDNTSFSFKVSIQLPHEKSFTDFKTVTASENTPYKLGGLPVGTQVKIEEVDKDGYTVDGNAVQTITISKPEDDDTYQTVSYVNKKSTLSATVEASKTLDGSASSTKFNFALTKLNGGAKSTAAADIQTGQNGTDGKISFTVNGLESGSTYNYLLEETSTTNGDYTCDTNKYLVEVNASSSPATVKYYKATVNGTTYTKEGAELNGVTFANTTNPKKGSVKVTKKGSDGALLKDVTIALVEATKSGNEWVPATGKTPISKGTNEQGIVEFKDLTPGDYVVYETQSVEGYELYGKYEHVTVTANETAAVTITDPKSTQLPQTGGVGVVVLVVIGIALVSVGIFLLKPTKKEKTNSK